MARSRQIRFQENSQYTNTLNGKAKHPSHIKKNDHKKISEAKKKISPSSKNLKKKVKQHDSKKEIKKSSEDKTIDKTIKKTRKNRSNALSSLYKRGLILPFDRRPINNLTRITIVGICQEYGYDPSKMSVSSKAHELIYSFNTRKLMEIIMKARVSSSRKNKGLKPDSILVACEPTAGGGAFPWLTTSQPDSIERIDVLSYLKNDPKYLKKILRTKDGEPIIKKEKQENESMQDSEIEVEDDDDDENPMDEDISGTDNSDKENTDTINSI